jgi:hypothetical protein
MDAGQLSLILNAFTIILLLFIIWRVVRVERLTSNYVGGGLTDQVYTSGATMRRLGQVFTSTDQGIGSSTPNPALRAALIGE